MASAGICIRAASANSSSTRAAPSSIEYSVWTCRWTKLGSGIGGCCSLPSNVPSTGGVREFPTGCGQNDTGVILAGEPTAAAGAGQTSAPVRTACAPRRAAGTGWSAAGWAEPVEHRLEVVGERLGQLDRAAVAGVAEAEPEGVQEGPPEPQAGGERGVGAVAPVARQRVAQVGEVGADLVGAA